MAELIAIGYRDMGSAFLAMDGIARRSEAIGIQPDAVAAIVRDRAGRFMSITNADTVERGGPVYAMFWGLLFGHLFFVPFLGMNLGTALGSLVGMLEHAAIHDDFETRVRESLAPGTSALFAMVESTPDSFVRSVGPPGGVVMTTTVPRDAHARMQEALHGRSAPVAGT